MTNIMLPKISKTENAKGHPFPFQIGLQAMRFIQGSIFYFTLMDEAAGQFFQQQNSDEKIKTLFSGYGYSDSTWEISWSCFQEYLTLFPKQIFRMSLLSMKSHWDWYITQLGNFILFAKDSDKDQLVDDKDRKNLEKIGFKNITEQFEIIRKVTDCVINLPLVLINSLSELALVRNLGIHNQWEIDDTYLKWSEYKQWKKGELRTFAIDELQDWHRSLIEAIQIISPIISRKYVSAPDYFIKPRS